MKAAWAAVRNVRQNMRQICESQKYERKTSAMPPDTFDASFRTEAPDRAADSASRSPKPVVVVIGVVVHRQRRSSFVSLFIVASCRVGARTNARAVSWPRRVLGAQHDCRNGKQQPALTQLYPRPSILLLHSLHLRLSLVRSLSLAASLAAAATARLASSLLLSVTFSMPSKQLLSVCLLLLFFWRLQQHRQHLTATERLQCCPTLRRNVAPLQITALYLSECARSLNDSPNGKQISLSGAGGGGSDY